MRLEALSCTELKPSPCTSIPLSRRKSGYFAASTRSGKTIELHLVYFVSQGLHFVSPQYPVYWGHAIQAVGSGLAACAKAWLPLAGVCWRIGIDPKPKCGLEKRTSNRTFNTEPIGMTWEIPSWGSPAELDGLQARRERATHSGRRRVRTPVAQPEKSGRNGR